MAKTPPRGKLQTIKKVIYPSTIKCPSFNEDKIKDLLSLLKNTESIEETEHLLKFHQLIIDNDDL